MQEGISRLSKPRQREVVKSQQLIYIEIMRERNSKGNAGSDENIG